MITQENIKHVCHGDIFGTDIIFFESTSSTNDSAIEIGRNRAHKVKDQIIRGTAEAVTRSGGLLIRLPDGKEEIINSGDVTILKE